MILGFISLLLNFGQSYIVRICISQKLAEKMLPCSYDGSNESSRRKLLSHERRYLESDTSSSQCNEVTIFLHLVFSDANEWFNWQGKCMIFRKGLESTSVKQRKISLVWTNEICKETVKVLINVSMWHMLKCHFTYLLVNLKHFLRYPHFRTSMN